MTTPEIYNEIWKRGQYRNGSTCQRLLPFLRSIIPPGSTVNDYGCGTGRAERGLLEFCSRVNMVDFAAEALEDEARELLGERLTYAIAPLDRLPEDFPVSDWGICINVLMLADPGKLDAILGGIRRTCRNLVVEVYDWSDIRLGVDRTLIKKDAAWWAETLRRFWPKVESVKSPEHPRRHIVVCRSE